MRNEKAHELVTTGSPEKPGLPCAMVLTVSFALSSVTGLCCHRRQRKISSANLTPASGRQDHTTSPSVKAPFVRAKICARRLSVHRIPSPTFVTIASRPSFGDETEIL
jgi:hypothetical protein